MVPKSGRPVKRWFPVAHKRLWCLGRMERIELRPLGEWWCHFMTLINTTSDSGPVLICKMVLASLVIDSFFREGPFTRCPTFSSSQHWHIKQLGSRKESSSLWPVYALGDRSWLLQSYRNNYTHKDSGFCISTGQGFTRCMGYCLAQGPTGSPRHTDKELFTVIQRLISIFRLLSWIPLTWV